MSKHVSDSQSIGLSVSFSPPFCLQPETDDLRSLHSKKLGEVNMQAHQQKPFTGGVKPTDVEADAAASD